MAGTFEMTTKVTVTGRGLDTSIFRSRLEDLVELVARNVEKRAKDVVPVDTGATKSSIFVDRKGLSATVGPTTEYAPFLEFGTVHMSARAFMTPSLEAERSNLEKGVNQIISQMGQGR
jgi:HK97 gp10 family phage protein